jgi:hypothetical protein
MQKTDVSEVRTNYIIRMITLMMEAERTSETSVYPETTRHYIPGGSNLHIFFPSFFVFLSLFSLFILLFTYIHFLFICVFIYVFYLFTNLLVIIYLFTYLFTITSIKPVEISAVNGSY